MPGITISALFVRKDSVYKTLEIDCWDIERDAMNWPGGNPIVAHPPCRAWGKFSWSANPRPGEKELAIKAIEWVREWGGYWNTRRQADYGQHSIYQCQENMMNTEVSVSASTNFGLVIRRRKERYYTYVGAALVIYHQRLFALMQLPIVLM